MAEQFKCTNYREFVELIYQDPQPLFEIEKLVNVKACKSELPKVDGDYLVYHMKYGYCIYGFTIKDRWGYDDKVVRPDGTHYHQVTHWGSLEFLEN